MHGPTKEMTDVEGWFILVSLGILLFAIAFDSTAKAIAGAALLWFAVKE